MGWTWKEAVRARGHARVSSHRALSEPLVDPLLFFTGGGGMTHEQIAQIQMRLASMTPAEREALLATLSATLGPEAAGLLSLLGSGAPGGGIAGLPPGGSIPPGATVVSLTAAEAAAVERLVSMGFSKQCVRAACGRRAGGSGAPRTQGTNRDAHPSFAPPAGAPSRRTLRAGRTRSSRRIFSWTTCDPSRGRLFCSAAL